MQKVLCATDLSEASDEAVRQADAWCAGSEAELTVMHVEPPLYAAAFVGEGLPAVSPAELEALRARGRQGLEEQARRVGLRTANRRLELVPAGGPVYAELVRRAEAGKVDLLAVGGYGASGLARILIGSVADQVVRYAHCPVLVARRAPDSHEVLVGSDLSAGARAALLAAAREATRRKARLTVLHALGYPPDLMAWGFAPLVPAPAALPGSRAAQTQAAEERLIRELRELHIEAKVVIAEGEPSASLVRYAESLPAELVVVGASGKTALARVLLGSIAEAVVHKSPGSVLVTRHHPLPAPR